MNAAMHVHQPRALVHRDVNRYKLIAIALAIMLAGMALMAAPALGDSAALRILAHLGMFLAPTGLITLIYEVALRRSFLAEVREQLSASLASHFHAAERL